MPTIKLGKNSNNIRDKNTIKTLYQKVYQNSRWKRLRAAKFANNPLCEDCLLKGIIKQTEEIHHIIPFDVEDNIEKLESLAYNYDNLISLCIECHKLRHLKLKA